MKSVTAPTFEYIREQIPRGWRIDLGHAGDLRDPALDLVLKAQFQGESYHLTFSPIIRKTSASELWEHWLKDTSLDPKEVERTHYASILTPKGIEAELSRIGLRLEYNQLGALTRKGDEEIEIEFFARGIPHRLSGRRISETFPSGLIVPQENQYHPIISAPLPVGILDQTKDGIRLASFGGPDSAHQKLDALVDRVIRYDPPI